MACNCFSHKGSTQSAMIVERLFMAIGATLLMGSALQYRASTSVTKDDYDAKLLLSRRLSHLRADQFVPTAPWRGEDGHGIESLLGRVCITYSSDRYPYPLLSNCTWNKDQNFNFSGNGTISVAVNNRQLCLAETTPSQYLLDVEVGLSLLQHATSRYPDDPRSQLLALSLEQQQQQLHERFRPRGALMPAGMAAGSAKAVSEEGAIGNSTIAEHSVVLTRCNASDVFQRWNYSHVIGRFKRFGALINQGSHRCLARNTNRRSASFAAANQAIVAQRCDEVAGVHRGMQGRVVDAIRAAWYLPKEMQGYHNASAVPTPLPWEHDDTTNPTKGEHTTYQTKRTTHLGRKKRRRRRTTTVDPAVAHGNRTGKILCWILTHPDAHDTKAVAVNRTWGTRCDFLVFVTSEMPSNGLPALVVDLHGPEARDKIWNKTKKAWAYVYENYYDKADWFVKADDDTYINMDNMRHFLASKNASHPKYYGRPFKHAGHVSHSYYSGGSGIVFSRATLGLLHSAVNNTGGMIWARPHSGPEDLNTARLLARINIFTEPTVDAHGRQMFLPLGPQFEYNSDSKDKNFWFFKYSPEAKSGKECCSEHWISSHYVREDDMYRLDNLESLQCPLDASEWPHWGRRQRS